MRAKSPAAVQRWEDLDSVTELTGDTLIEVKNNKENCNSITLTEIEKCINFDGKIGDDLSSNIVQPNIVDITKQVDKLIERFDEDDDHNDDDDNNSKAQSKTIECENPVTTVDLNACDTIASGIENPDIERRFWKKGASSVLSALRLRSESVTDHSTETDDLNASPQLCPNNDLELPSTTPINSILNKSKLNEFVHKLNISKKRYNFIRDRKMDAQKLLHNAKSRLLAATHWEDVPPQTIDNEQDNPENPVQGDNNLIKCPVEATTESTELETTIIKPTATTLETEVDATVKSETSDVNASAVCDTIDMDLSADEYSRLSQSNDMLSGDDEDNFNASMPSIDSQATHLNISRRLVMADIGRSTSDNPRLRNKFYLADIGRSFSEHQDEEAIIIGERNISAPSSSIAIQNNFRSNGNFFERRAYSVSPTQRSLKRGILSRDHSLSDNSRHRNQLSKGSSFQSDSSHCSSVESLLDARKPDSEAILRQLGFGPAHQEDLLSRIPKRFLHQTNIIYSI